MPMWVMIIIGILIYIVAMAVIAILLDGDVPFWYTILTLPLILIIIIFFHKQLKEENEELSNAKKKIY